MRVGIDFKLSRHLGVVEKSVFSMILCGYNRINDIVDVLRLFSPEVLATAIMNLVNLQLLCVNEARNELTLSALVSSLVERCLVEEFEAEFPVEICQKLEEGACPIIELSPTLDRDVNREMISSLLPGINITPLAKSVTVYLVKRGDNDG